MPARRGVQEVLAGMPERRPEPLLALSMVMTSSRDETEILHIATTAVPSLGGCRVGAVYLDGGWQATIKAPEFPRSHGQAQVALKTPPQARSWSRPCAVT